MGCFSVLRAPPSPLGSLDDSSATEHRSYAKMCTWGQEENKGKVSRAAAQDGHKQEVFFFPLACQMQLWESRAPCWSVALPCQNRYPFGIAKPRRGYPVKVAVWSSLNKFCVSGNYHSVGQSTWSCGCWHTSSTNREKKCQGYFNKGFQWKSKAC